MMGVGCGYDVIALSACVFDAWSCFSGGTLRWSGRMMGKAHVTMFSKCFSLAFIFYSGFAIFSLHPYFEITTSVANIFLSPSYRRYASSPSAIA